MKRWQDVKKINNRFLSRIAQSDDGESWSDRHYNWLSEVTLRECEMLKRLDEAVGKFIGV